MFIYCPAILAAYLKGLKDYCFRSVSRQEVALKVEETTPELMDSYICAMEIAEKGGGRFGIVQGLHAIEVLAR